MSTQQHETIQQQSPPPPSSRTSLERIAILEQKLGGYKFRDHSLALESLQTGSLPQEVYGRFCVIPDNKELAILGDILNNLHLCLQWDQTNDSRAAFESSKQLLVSNENLARIGHKLGLGECIIRTPGSGLQIGRKSMATTVEAIIGAVYKDAENHWMGSGFDAAFRVATEFGIIYGS